MSIPLPTTLAVHAAEDDSGVCAALIPVTTVVFDFATDTEIALVLTSTARYCQLPPLAEIREVD